MIAAVQTICPTTEVTPLACSGRRCRSEFGHALPVAAPLKQSNKEKATSKPSIVFAHGIWANGSCFQKLIPTLRAEGHEVMAAQYGLDTLKGDVDATIRTFGRVSGPIVLVGHSYGGTVITHAGVDPGVAALVYTAALGPDETETSQSEQEKFITTDVFKNIDVADGRVRLKPDSGVACFVGDLSADEQGLAYATHSVPALDLFTQKLDGIAWRSKPSGTSLRPRTASSILTCKGSPPSAWAPRPRS